MNELLTYNQLLSDVQEAIALNKELSLKGKFGYRKHSPYFIDRKRSSPIYANAQTINDIPMSQLVFGTRTWSVRENTLLQKAITRQCLMQSFDVDTEKSTLELLVESYTRDLDWCQISREVHSRSSLECQSEWLFHKYPLLNFKQFSKQELDKLEELAQKYNYSHWHLNGRVPWHVYKTYLLKIKKIYKLGKWTSREDQILKDSVAKLGVKSWTLIASNLPNRSPSQCLQRWNFTLSPKIKKGKWTKEEDVALLDGISKFGRGKWKLISSLVPGRTDAQIRERFENVLNPDINRGPWTQSEREKLISLVESIGNKWSIISQELKNRTDNMCKREWKKIQSRKEEIQSFK